jgi:hypothetical protein
MLSITEISQLFDDITKAASRKAEPITYTVLLMKAGRQTEVSTVIALALMDMPPALAYAHGRLKAMYGEVRHIERHSRRRITVQ